MNLMMPIYTVRWEREAATQNQKRVEQAGLGWLACSLRRARLGRRRKRLAQRNQL